MKKILQILGVLGLMVIISGARCQNSIICDLGKKAAAAAAGSIATTLQCKNTAAIQASMEKLFLQKSSVCQNPNEKTEVPKGPISMMVCPIASKMIVDLGLKAIPKEWECNPTIAENMLEQTLTTACIAVIPY